MFSLPMMTVSTHTSMDGCGALYTCTYSQAWDAYGCAPLWNSSDTICCSAGQNTSLCPVPDCPAGSPPSWPPLGRGCVRESLSPREPLPHVITAASPWEHRQRLARQQRGGGITQRWVGSQSGMARVTQMACSFRVPLDSQIARLPHNDSAACHYIYCDLHNNGWPGGLFGQFVPQLVRHSK